jgi:sodium/potassium-transporting ATPase subunit alpha
LALEFTTLDWHTISPEEILRRLSTNGTSGLSTDQVKRRLTEYGRNTLSPPPSHQFQQIFKYFFTGFGPILFIGFILVFISWKPLGQPPAQANLALAIVLLAVFFIQAAFNAWQDWSSSRVMASITTMLPDQCPVMRDGAQAIVIASEIVPGDVLPIKAGNKLPADVRFLRTSSDAKFDRSILTGKISLTFSQIACSY